jgi:hypothetical protein
MQKLALVALVAAGLFIACGGGNNTHIVDSSIGSGSSATCDPIAQTGCSGSTPRCTWIQDTASVGHVGCEAAGTVALGGACSAGSALPAFDDCDAGLICIGGKCETICDNNAGGSACGSGYACGIYSGLFEVNGAFVAGACDKTCDPLTDNSFGNGSDGIPLKTGTTCGSNQGCYGFPSSDANNLTHFTCSGEVNPNLVNRDPCTMADNCAPDSSSVYLNGCAQGYIPLLNDMSIGTTTAVCIAYCAPQNCYQGNCGSDNNAQVGSAGHACLLSDIRNNTMGEPLPSGSAASSNSCIYSWVFEENGSGVIADSQYDDTLGFCYDHTKYRYDSNNNGMIDQGDAFDPPCNMLPGSGSNVLNAADLGCISVATATALGDLSGSGGFRERAHRYATEMPRFTPGVKAALRNRLR